jgi:hypothetical protein
MLDDFGADIMAIGDRILDSDWDAVRPVRIEICAHCDFLSRCQTYWRQQERREKAEDGLHSEDGI